MRNVITLSAVAASAAVIGIVGAIPAGADPTTAGFGASQKVTDGAVVSSYAVWMPKPSDHVVNVPIVGKLYEAKTTVEAVQGAVSPSIPFFNARTGSGDNYRVLWQAYAPEGLNGATLPQGGKATGKIYFDVTGPAPTSVVYNDAVQDRLIWGGGGSSGASAPASAPAASAPAAESPSATPPVGSGIPDRRCGSDLFTGTPLPC